VKEVADRGVRVKAFGSKMWFLVSSIKGLTKHPNIEFLGRVPVDKLVELYSNALFTIFPFTHEPFGYIPLESMACGTPVLTYNMQGPGEYVTDGVEGWLVGSDSELVEKAVKLWKEGYPEEMRRNCILAASMFDRRIYIEKWMKILNIILESSIVDRRAVCIAL
jgi:glycosyltransferase involved in cell wall biosynthesis